MNTETESLNFNVNKLDDAALTEQLKKKIDLKTKPLGSLGLLEELALKIGRIFGTTSPKLKSPSIIVFAADHGIALEGVSMFPQEVTWQMVMNYLSGGAAINVFAKQNGIDLKIVDGGVNYDFNNHPGLIHSKLSRGTKNFAHEPAMTVDECFTAIKTGGAITAQAIDAGCNIVGFGEMGIGNTSAASMIMSRLCNIPLAECVGAGTGFNSEGVLKKLSILERADKVHASINNNDPMEVLATFGGLEIAMMCGGMLKAAEKRAVVMIDGFIATSALLAASKMCPEVLDYCIFTHVSNESGHRKMLEHLNAKPVLNLGMRLGEGTGAAVAYPIIKSAVEFLNEMASFESAGVSEAVK